MKKAVRALLLILVFSFVVSTISCTGKNGEQTTASGTSTGTSETNSDAYYETLGAKDFNGDSLWILDLNFNPDIHINFSEDISEDAISTALYKRDMFLSQEYNINFEYFSNAAGSSVVSRAINAGESIADVIYGRASGDRLLVLAQGGFLLNMADLPYLDFSRDWWSKQITESLTINNTLYFTAGDILPSYYQSPGCMFYNLNLGEQYGVNKDDLYTKVDNGEWTWDVLNTITADLDKDLNNDSKITADKDFYGFLTYNVSNHTNMFAISAGIDLCSVDEEGKWSVNWDNEHTLQRLEKLKSIVSLTDYGSYANSVSMIQVPFMEGRALFAEHFMESSFTKLREMEQDYVMLPFPKYETTQESYRGMVNSYVNCFVGVLNTCADTEMAGFILEAMAYTSYKDIRPIVYETTLKHKLARDEDAVAMIDMIMESSYLDYNVITSFGSSHAILYNYLKLGYNFSSQFAAAKESINAAVQTAMSAFKD